MDQVDKSKASIVVFIILLLIIGVGGFFLIRNDDESNENGGKEKTYDEIKIDKEKDFVYYTDLEVVSSEMEVIYQTININVDSNDATMVSKEINAKIPSKKSSIKYISKEEMPEDKNPLYYVDDIYSADVMDYTFYRYQNKLLVQTREYTYDCFGSGGEHTITSYIFNLNDGSLIQEELLLEEYQISKEDLINKIAEKVNDIASNINVGNGEDIVNYAATMDQINKDNYSLYIGKNGDLMVNIVVITNEINYNEDIVIS